MQNHGNSAGTGVCRPLITIFAIAVVLCGPRMSIAQVLYGSLVGNVTDANGAVVPAALVSATNQGTGASISGKTDTAGTYQFVNLQPGAYALKVAMPGFKALERR